MHPLFLRFHLQQGVLPQVTARPRKAWRPRQLVRGLPSGTPYSCGLDPPTTRCP